MDTAPNFYNLGIDKWSVEDRLRLIVEIENSLPFDAMAEITPELRAELDRRITEADAHPELGIPMEEAMASLRARQ